MLYINNTDFNQGDIIEIKNTISANIKAVVAIILEQSSDFIFDNRFESICTYIIVLRDEQNNVYVGTTSDEITEEHITVIEIPNWDYACTHICNTPITFKETKLKRI